MRTALVIWLLTVLSGALGCLLISSTLEALIGKVTLYDEYPAGRIFGECWRIGFPVILTLSSLRVWGGLTKKRSDVYMLPLASVLVTGAGIAAAFGLWALSRLHLLPARATDVLPVHRAWFQTGLLSGTCIAVAFALLGVIIHHLHDCVPNDRKSSPGVASFQAWTWPGESLPWTKCVYGLFLWDVLRDPLRKLMPSYQLGVIGVGVFLWLITLSCWHQQLGRKEDLRQLGQKWSPFLAALAAYLFWTLAAGLYHRVPVGVMLLGGFSFLIPLVGIPVGFSFWRDEREARRLVCFFCVINAFAVTSGVVEAIGVKSRILGGIVMEWYRFRGDISIPLPSGIFRSPDLMGFHAALLAAFAWVLYWDQRKTRRGVWLLTLCLHGVVVLILSARRKMLGLFIVFLTTWVLQRLPRTRTKVQSSLVVRSIVLGALVSTVVAITLPNQIQYALTVFTEMPERIWSSIIGSVVGTMQQSGWWGTGLGTATQGNTYFAPSGSFGWQEDGLGRLVREGGVLATGILLSGSLLTAHRYHLFSLYSSSNEERDWIGTALRSFFLGNVACILISHQHVSGDPFLASILAFFAAGISSGSRKIAHD